MGAVDTNVLVRLLVADDPAQTKRAVVFLISALELLLLFPSLSPHTNTKGKPKGLPFCISEKRVSASLLLRKLLPLRPGCDGGW